MGQERAFDAIRFGQTRVSLREELEWARLVHDSLARFCFPAHLVRQGGWAPESLFQASGRFGNDKVTEVTAADLMKRRVRPPRIAWSMV